MKAVVDANKAANVLGMPPQKLRVNIQNKRYKYFGEISKTGKKKEYEVYLYKAAEYFGIPIDVLEKRWDELYGEDKVRE